MSRKNDLIGQRFDRLLVIKYAYTKNNRSYWLCKCDCGNEVCVRGSSLTTCNTKSCGCYNLEVATKQLFMHGMKHTRFYNIWCGMKARCYNQNNPKYRIYGARGITVCDRWKDSFIVFKEDMYESYLKHCDEFEEKNTTLDRIDVNGNYEPSNCRWATWKEQRVNQRGRKCYEFSGKSYNIHELAELFNESNITTLRSRLKNNNFNTDYVYDRWYADE